MHRLQVGRVVSHLIRLSRHLLQPFEGAPVLTMLVFVVEVDRACMQTYLYQALPFRGTLYMNQSQGVPCMNGVNLKDVDPLLANTLPEWSSQGQSQIHS